MPRPLFSKVGIIRPSSRPMVCPLGPILSRAEQARSGGGGGSSFSNLEGGLNDMKAGVKWWKKSVARISWRANIFPGGGAPCPPGYESGAELCCRPVQLS